MLVTKMNYLWWGYKKNYHTHSSNQVVLETFISLEYYTAVERIINFAATQDEINYWTFSTATKLSTLYALFSKLWLSRSPEMMSVDKLHFDWPIALFMNSGGFGTERWHLYDINQENNIMAEIRVVVAVIYIDIIMLNKIKRLNHIALYVTVSTHQRCKIE